MNPLLVSGIGLTWAAAAFLFSVAGLHPLTAVLLALALVQTVGLGLVASGSRVLGAHLVLWPAVLTIPTGLLAAFGARRVLDQASLDRFNRRSAA